MVDVICSVCMSLSALSDVVLIICMLCYCLCCVWYMSFWFDLLLFG